MGSTPLGRVLSCEANPDGTYTLTIQVGDWKHDRPPSYHICRAPVPELTGKCGFVGPFFFYHCRRRKGHAGPHHSQCYEWHDGDVKSSNRT